MNTFALILAGGKGNRFWPRSSPTLPKQFLTLLGNESLLQATFFRARKVWDAADIYVVTTAQYENYVRWQLPDLPGENILIEPVGRDTAAAVGYAFSILGEAHVNDIAVVIPSDHYIEEGENWYRAIATACQVAFNGIPTLIGITPTRPETAFGYILLSQPLSALTGPAYRVAQFIEKPNLQKARQLLQQGNCLWNTGMFIWRVDTAMSLLNHYLPETMSTLDAIKLLHQKGNSNTRGAIRQEIEKRYSTIPAVSLDYGVIEKAPGIMVVPGNFNWDDLGGWLALERLNSMDKQENVVLGKALLQDTEGCLVDCPSGPALIIGVKDLVIACQQGGLLVCAKDKLQHLKSLLNSSQFVAVQQAAANYQQQGLPQQASIVFKPWGREIWWAVTEAYAAKILEIKAGHTTSLHLHQQKHETFYGQSGQGYLLLNGARQEIDPGIVVTIPPKAPHRFFALTDLQILEVSTPQLDDVVRLEDDYGRLEESAK